MKDSHLYNYFRNNNSTNNNNNIEKPSVKMNNVGLQKVFD